MTLQNIETAILQIIGFDRFSSLSVDTNAEKIEDFALLHRCVNMARDEIRIGTIIPALLKHATTITSIAGTKQYTISDTDFDIPVAVRYKTSDDEFNLTKATPQNILDKVGDTTTQGTPSVYMIFGSTSAGLSYIELYNIPSKAAESLDIDYKPVLSDLTTSTDEDIIMKKYPQTVIQIASAYAFLMIKKDSANFDKWLVLGRISFRDINLREVGFDNEATQDIDSLIASKRRDRFTR